MKLPVSLTAKGRDADGDFLYEVCFKHDGTQTAHVFTVSDSKIPVASGDSEFRRLTDGDPGADALLQAVHEFHHARLMSE
jgi:hypothetical protein